MYTGDFRLIDYDGKVCKEDLVSSVKIFVWIVKILKRLKGVKQVQMGVNIFNLIIYFHNHKWQLS